MRILFICGGIEPGKDGVGDYVRTLANEVKAHNEYPGIIALNDRFIDKEFVDRTDIPILRLGALYSWKLKINRLKEWISEFQPDHIVWEFLLYTFDPRGLAIMPVFRIAFELRNYSNVSIMFHEIWMGTAKEDKLQEKIIGFMQRSIINCMLKLARPNLIFTSNSIFQNALCSLGRKCTLLPLFSNIPHVEGARGIFLKHFDHIQVAIPLDAIKIVLFGRIAWKWQLEGFVNQIQKLLMEKPVYVFTLGRSDQMEAGQLEFIINKMAPSIRFIHFGEQPVEIVSGILQYSDFGLSINSPQTIAKSGVFAAYKDHGLPVILGGVEKEYRQSISDNGCQDVTTVYIDANFATNLKRLPKTKILDSRKMIANEFLSILKELHFNKLGFIAK